MRDVRLTTVACQNCHGKASWFFDTRDRNRRISGDEFSYYRCQSCGLVFLDPVPPDLGRYYPADYYGDAPDTIAPIVAGAELHESYKIEILKKYAKSGRLLEIGPSMGGFAILAKRAGFSVEGIELNDVCCRFLNEVAGIHTIRAENEVGALSQVGDADVIALWQVIEHLTNPFELLLAASRKLRPGGVMIIAAPNPESIQFRLFKGTWVHVDAPRHVCLIPIPLLRTKLSDLGFEVVEETTQDPGTIAWNEFGWVYSLSGLSSTPGRKKRLADLGKKITGWLRFAEEGGRRGSCYTIIARKL